MPHPSRIDRDQLLSEARRLLETEGLDGLSMRQLARRVGVRAPSLYFHVESRDDLLREIISEGLQELGVRLEAAAGSGGASRDRLHAMAGAYVAFAEESPHRFALIFGPCPIERRPDDDLGAQASAAVLAVAEGLVGPEHALFFAEAVWSLVHGYTMLRLAEQFRINPDHEAGFRYSLDLLIDAVGRPLAAV
jgi:AcrR family transcriptional regulator